jgi:hypothetical protein
MSKQSTAEKACRLCYAEGVADGRREAQREALAEIARLTAENARLKEDGEILEHQRKTWFDESEENR